MVYVGNNLLNINTEVSCPGDAWELHAREKHHPKYTGDAWQLHTHEKHQPVIIVEDSHW